MGTTKLTTNGSRLKVVLSLPICTKRQSSWLKILLSKCCLVGRDYLYKCFVIMWTWVLVGDNVRWFVECALVELGVCSDRLQRLLARISSIERWYVVDPVMYVMRQKPRLEAASRQQRCCLASTF